MYAADFSRIVTLNIRDHEKEILRCSNSSIGEKERLLRAVLLQAAMRNGGWVRIMYHVEMRYQIESLIDDRGYLDASKEVFIFDEDSRRWKTSYLTGFNDSHDWYIAPDLRIFLWSGSEPRSIDWHTEEFMKLLGFKDGSVARAFCYELMRDLRNEMPRKMEFLPNGKVKKSK